jgi:PAS domain S-box-containing protein
MDMGASYYIRKPAPSSVLLSSVRDILANPKAFPHKIPTKPESAQLMQQYSAKLIAKLEQSNIDLEEARKKIEQREKYFRALVENDYSITVLQNEKFETIYRSPSAEAILGWTNDEMDKIKPEDFVHPNDREQQRTLMKRAMTNPDRAFPITTRLKHKNGSYIWLEGITINKLSDSTVAGIVTNLHDVTERKLAEAELGKASETLREAQAIARLGNWEMDLATNATTWSDEVYDIYGYTPDEMSPTTESFLTLLHPEDVAFASHQVEKTFSTFADASFEYRFIKKGGGVRHGYTKWKFEFDSTGKPIRLYGIIQDITERKEAEAKLAASEKRFRAIIENSSDAIVLSNEQLGLIYQSPSVSRILGYSPEDRYGKRSLEYVHLDDRARALQVNALALESPGVAVPFQYRARHRDGHYLWLEGFLTNLTKDPSVQAYVANYRDITSRKEADEALARTLRRFEQAQQIAHLGNWEIDFDTQKIIWSDEAFHIYGIEPHTIGPSEDLFLEHVHPDDMERVRTTTQQAQQTLAPFSLYHRIVQPSGMIRNMFTVGRFEFDQSGKPRALYGISQDITELTEKEMELERANKELATFIYKAYHDLRSPIVSVLGMVNLAKIDIKDELSQQYFNTIHQIAEKQNRMLLSLIKVMSIRERELVFTPVDLAQLVSEVIQSLETVEGFSELKFLNNAGGELLTDRELMFDIISNLLENAIVYRDQSRSTCEVTINSESDMKMNLVFEIADNGLGIAEDVKGSVFDLFFRGSEASKGSGLGLYLVKNAVEKLGGTIQLYSTKGKGTTFQARIPLST